MYDLRCTMYDFREGTQIGLMIKIRTYHNHHNHLRSPFVFPSYIVHHKSHIRNYSAAGAAYISPLIDWNS
jgi:hypothetical protein